MTEPPMYMTVAIGNSWGVGRLMAQDDGHWWVDVRRSGLQLADAADLRDTWNARGAEKR